MPRSMGKHLLEVLHLIVHEHDHCLVPQACSAGYYCIADERCFLRCIPKLSHISIQANLENIHLKIFQIIHSREKEEFILQPVFQQAFLDLSCMILVFFAHLNYLLAFVSELKKKSSCFCVYIGVPSVLQDEDITELSSWIIFLL